MNREALRYVQTFISDWLAAPIPTTFPDMRSIEYYEGPDGEIRFFADFRYGDKKIGFRNKIQNSYELGYFDTTMKVLKKEVYIHWDKDPEPDYIDDKQCIYTFVTDLDEDLEDYILLPINTKDYKFADNVNAVIFDNIKNKIIISITDLDNLEGCKISFVAYKPKGDE